MLLPLAGSLTHGTTGATGSAQFTSVTSGSEDFHLKGTAALLGAATNISGITTDIIGTTRPQSGFYDIGAFEYIRSSGNGPTPGISVFGVTP